MQLIEFEGLTAEQNKRIAKITTYKVGFSKLWDTKTGRNSMSGAFKGTLLGIFPKLTITFGKHNGDDRALLLKIVNGGFKNVTYFDAELKKKVTKEFYFGDAEDEIKKAIGDNPDKFIHQPITIEIVATTRRERQ